MPDYFYGFLGLFVGSFLNVCIWRLPRGESLVFPGSHCTECGHRIGAEDLVPVLSWVVLKGKCRECLSRISSRYPAVEVAAGLLFWYSAARSQGQGEVVFLKNIILLSALLVIFFIDLDHQIIPDAISLPLIPLGLVFAAFAGWQALVYSALAGAAGFGGFYLIAWLGEVVFRKESMGGGDIKLAAGLGTFLGVQSLAVGMFLAFLIGAAVGIPVTLLGGRKLREPIPFGPMMAAGAAIALFEADAITAWWSDKMFSLWGLS